MTDLESQLPFEIGNQYIDEETIKWINSCYINRNKIKKEVSNLIKYSLRIFLICVILCLIKFISFFIMNIWIEVINYCLYCIGLVFMFKLIQSFICYQDVINDRDFPFIF